MKKEFENKLIERFINENGLNNGKFNFKENAFGVLVIDNNNETMLVTQPLFTDNLIKVYFEDHSTREYHLKYHRVFNIYQWNIIGE